MIVLTWFERFLRDLRFGARNLARDRAFTAIALGSLALGIGGSTAMYSVIYAVIVDPFPYQEVDRLMSVAVQSLDQRGGNGSYYTIDQFLEIAQRNRIFSGVVASTWSDVTWTGEGDPQRLRGNHCTMNTFQVMGVPPLLGRAAAPSDAVEGAEPVTVLGYKFWQRQWGGDPGVLGRRLTLNGKVRTVIGVMPQRFMWRGADVYLPDVFHRGEDVEGVHEVHLLGRLNPGVTAPQAEADLRGIIQELKQRDPKDFPEQWRIALLTFKETFPSGITDALWILFGAVGILLLIACVNVSNLLLSRAGGRRKEIAVRASLGASRFRLVSQLLAESLLLGVAGGLLGVLVAMAGLRSIIAMVPPNTIPDEAQIALNTPVLWFSLAVSVAAALLFGLAPAWHMSGRDIATPLKEAGRGASGTKGQRMLRGVFVVGEVALSLMLLVGASLMIRTLIAIHSVDMSFHPDRVLTMRIPFSSARYPDANRRAAFLEEVLRRIGTVPGVVAVGINSGLPPIYNATAPVEVPGNTQQENRPVMIHQINADYSTVMGTVLVQGRFFTAQEVHGRSHNAVVNQTFARSYFAGGSALGRLVRVPRMRQPPINATDDGFQVVGVVKDTVNRLGSNQILPEVYVPYTLAGMADRVFVLGKGRPEALDKAVREQVYAVDRGQPVMDVKTAERMLGEYVYARPRFNLFLFGLFAAIGLSLALFGVYGVIANTVAQRTHEIGIRIALGASFSQVIGMILSVGAKLLAVGVAVGLAGSLASVRVLKGLVSNVSTFDPYSFVAVTVVLFAAGLFASFWPARRAARVDPVTALRQE